MALRELLAKAIGLFPLVDDDDGIVAEYCDGDNVSSTAFVLTKKNFCELCAKMAKCISHLVKKSIIGLAFDSNKRSVTYLMPAVAAIIQERLVPFCVDPAQQTWNSIARAITDLDITCLLCDGCFLRHLQGLSTLSVDVTRKVFSGSDPELDIYLVSIASEDGAGIALCQLPEDADLAYVVQTSGSTGGRKTVFVTQESISPNIIDFQRTFQLDSSDRVLALSPATFDPFYVDLFLALLSGAILVFPSLHIKSRASVLFKVIKDRAVTFMQMTPQLYLNVSTQLEPHLASGKNLVKYVVVGGERFPKNFANLSLARTRFFQAYGITEMSCWQSLYEVPTAELNKPQPIYDVAKENLLSETHVKLCEELEDGSREIVVSSKTRLCYIHPPSDGAAGVEVGTRDMGRRDGGKIYFVDRECNHLKLRGKRTSLAEIESEVSAVMGGAQCVCLLHPDKKDFILAFVSGNEHEAEVVCRKKLPGHLCPAQFVGVPNFPVTGHGKIDGKALLALASLTKSYLGTPLQLTELKRLWQRFTGTVPETSSEFLSDGGDSFAAVLLLGALEERLGGKRCPDLLEVLLNQTFGDFQTRVQKLLILEEQTVVIKEDDPAVFDRNNDLSVDTGNNISYAVKGRVVGSIDDSIPHLLTPDRLKLVWSVDLGKCIDASPLLVKYAKDRLVVFIGSHSGAFAAIDFSSGNVLWRTSLPNRVEGTAIVSSDGCQVYVGCYDHHLYCFTAQNGTLIWKFQTGAMIKCTPAVIGGNSLIFGSYDKHAYCLDSSTGLLRWKSKVCNASLVASPLSVSATAGDSLTVAVILCALNGTVIAADLRDGCSLWERKLSSPVFGSPTRDNRNVLVGTAEGLVYCLAEENGLEIWRFQAGGPIFSSMVTSLSLVLFGCHDSRLYCLDSSDGTLKWTVEHTALVFATPFVSSILLGPEKDPYQCVISLSTDGQLALTSLNGSVLTRLKLDGEGADSFSSPLLCRGRLIVGRRDNKICSYSLTGD